MSIMQIMQIMYSIYIMSVTQGLIWLSIWQLFQTMILEAFLKRTNDSVLAH